MSDPFEDDMMKATRLTQAGRLQEATALLQRLLGIGNAHRVTNSGAPSSKSSLIDLTPSLDAPRTSVDSAERPAPGDTPHKLTGPLGGVFQRLWPVAPPIALHGLRKPAAPASDVAPSTGRFIAGSFRAEAGERAYKLYVPGRKADGHRPLVVMLHGCTQSADDFAAGTRMNFAAEEKGCFVLFPEQSPSANSSRCWNWFKSGDQKRGQGEPALVAAMTRQIIEEYKIDPKRVYIAGLSAGGAAAAVLAEAYPEIYAAVGVHSGLACGVASDMASAFAAMQGRHPVPDPKSGRQTGTLTQIPTIVFHGDRDSTVHPRNGAEVIARAQASGQFKTVTESGSEAAGHAFTRSVGRDAKGRGILEEWVIHGAGHAWSGGSPAGSFTDPQGPDATKEMLRFFLDHRR
jgi:poly(hydroxyalkanoate) depolymerase family esterase